MPNHNSYRSALAAIWDRSGYDRGFISDPFAGDEAARRGLRRTAAVLHRLGNPERRLPLIHVAGSKGKGSTTVLLDAILRAAGMRSGRFTSPHLHSYRERFVVDDAMIDEADFATLTAEVLATVEAVEATQPDLGRVTAFELTTAMALAWFAKAPCDVAVIEVGLGGSLDATNVIEPVVSAISRLDLEHTAILGDTLAEIAANKAGIIKPGRPAVTVAQEPEALAVIEARAREAGSSLLIGGRDWRIAGDEDGYTVHGPWGTVDGLRTSLVGPHQLENAGLAVAAIRAAGELSARISDDAIRRGLLDARHPGRFERFKVNDRTTVIIDGAHTPVAAEALATALARHHPDATPLFVAGMLQDKPPESFLAPLARRAAGWIVAPPDSPRAMATQVLAEALAALGQPVAQAASIGAALDMALAREPRLIVVAGSLTTAAEARIHLGLAQPEPPPA